MTIETNNPLMEKIRKEILGKVKTYNQNNLEESVEDVFQYLMQIECNYAEIMESLPLLQYYCQEKSKGQKFSAELEDQLAFMNVLRLLRSTKMMISNLQPASLDTADNLIDKKFKLQDLITKNLKINFVDLSEEQSAIISKMMQEIITDRYNSAMISIANFADLMQDFKFNEVQSGLHELAAAKNKATTSFCNAKSDLCASCLVDNQLLEEESMQLVADLDFINGLHTSLISSKKMKSFHIVAHQVNDASDFYFNYVGGPLNYETRNCIDLMVSSVSYPIAEAGYQFQKEEF